MFTPTRRIPQVIKEITVPVETIVEKVVVKEVPVERIIYKDAGNIQCAECPRREMEVRELATTRTRLEAEVRRLTLYASLTSHPPPPHTHTHAAVDLIVFVFFEERDFALLGGGRVRGGRRYVAFLASDLSVFKSYGAIGF